MFLFFTITLSITGGCKKEEAKVNESESYETRADRVLAYMYEKYGTDEEFEIIRVYSESAWHIRGTSQITFVLTTKKGLYGDGRIYLVYSLKNEEVIRDCYLDYLMKEKIENYITDLIKDIYQDYRVIYYPSPEIANDAKMPANISVEDYLQKLGSSNPWYLCVADDHDEIKRNDAVNLIQKAFFNIKLRTRLTIFYLPLEKIDSVYHMLENDLIYSYWISTRGDFMIDDLDDKFIYFNWRESPNEYKKPK